MTDEDRARAAFGHDEDDDPVLGWRDAVGLAVVLAFWAAADWLRRWWPVALAGVVLALIAAANLTGPWWGG